jgi:hypothetical protein
LPFSEGRESKYKEEKSAMGLAGLKPYTFKQKPRDLSLREGKKEKK